jgi:hypothetical protein
MVVLKCPKCGRLCREGLVPWPRCARCHEQLLKCRYCRHYDAQLLDCTSLHRADEPPIRDPDAYLACPYHSSRLKPVEKVVRRRVWMPGIAFVVVAGLIAFAAARIRAPSVTGPVLHARVEPIEESFLNEPLTVKLQVWNPGPGDVQQVIVSLDRSFEKHVKLDQADPTPLRQRRGRKWLRMWFGELKEGETLDLNLLVKPIRTGTWQLRADILSPDTPHREQIQATLEIAS